MADKSNSRCWARSMRQLTRSAVVGLLSCHAASAFVPSGQRLGAATAAVRSRTNCRSGVPPSQSPPYMLATRSSAGDNKVHSNIDDTHTDRETSTAAGSSWMAASKSAVACLATAAILASSLPTGSAQALTPRLDGSLPRGMGGSGVMMLSDEESSTASIEKADVKQLLSDLKRADRADTLLDSMVKINDVVDSDDDDLVENPFAKETLVKGLIDRRRAGGEAWDSNTETAFGILKRKLDPFNVVLLRPYLKIAPFLGGAYYLAVFFVQQKFRDFFPYAYFGAVAVFVAPALIIVLSN